MNTHPLAGSPTIKNSLIDWVTTFKNLPHNPGNTTEFITSGALYYIMEEIDPEYFEEWPYSVLNKQDLRAKQDPKVLRKVYKHMLEQMELWYEANSEAVRDMRPFRPDQIDLRKLVEQQDINQLLVVIEFILCIVLKCENCEILIENLGELPENAAEDMQELIEGANIQFSEAPTSFLGESFVENYEYKADLHDSLENADRKRREIELKMITMVDELQVK